MRRSACGPECCDRCLRKLKGPDLKVMRHLDGPPICMGCRTHLEKTRVFVKLTGTHCLFCGRKLLLPNLVDHFNREHGRVIVNW